MACVVLAAPASSATSDSCDAPPLVRWALFVDNPARLSCAARCLLSLPMPAVRTTKEGQHSPAHRESAEQGAGDFALLRPDEGCKPKDDGGREPGSQGRGDDPADVSARPSGGPVAVFALGLAGRGRRSWSSCHGRLDSISAGVAPKQASAPATGASASDPRPFPTCPQGPFGLIPNGCSSAWVKQETGTPS